MKCVGKLQLSFWLWPVFWLVVGLLLGFLFCWFGKSPAETVECPVVECPVVNCPEHPDVSITCPEPPAITLSCPEPVINVQCKGKKEECW